MDLAASVVNAALVLLVVIVLNYVIKDRFRQQDALIDARFQGLGDSLRARLDDHDRSFARIESELAALRSDLTHVALAVGARPRPQSR